MDKEDVIIDGKDKLELNGWLFVISTVLFIIFVIILPEDYEISDLLAFIFLILFIMWFKSIAGMISGYLRIKFPNNYINQKSNEKLDFDLYKSEWSWEDAAKEYLKLKGKEKIEDLTVEENEIIYEYASMPMVYFAMWLIENNLLSNCAYEDMFSHEYFDEIKNRKITPVDFIRNVDYCFVSDLISSSVLPFVDEYFYREYIEVDYPKCIKNDNNFIYCVDYSWEIYDKIAIVINTAYNKYNDKIVEKD